jgi:hypothetical protein
MEEKRLSELERISGDVLFWQSIASPKHQVEIVSQEATLDFGTFELNEGVEETNGGGDCSASLHDDALGEEPSISLDFLEGDQGENASALALVETKQREEDSSCPSQQQAKKRNMKKIRVQNKSPRNRVHLLKTFTVPREVEAGAKQVLLLQHTFEHFKKNSKKEKKKKKESPPFS